MSKLPRFGFSPGRRSPTVHGDYTMAPSYPRSVPALPLTLPMNSISDTYLGQAALTTTLTLLSIMSVKSVFTETYYN